MAINKEKLQLLTEATPSWAEQTEKMRKLELGIRGFNAAAASDEKLKMNYAICAANGWNKAKKIVEDELIRRGIITIVPASNTSSPASTATSSSHSYFDPARITADLFTDDVAKKLNRAYLNNESILDVAYTWECWDKIGITPNYTIEFILLILSIILNAPKYTTALRDALLVSANGVFTKDNIKEVVQHCQEDQTISAKLGELATKYRLDESLEEGKKKKKRPYSSMTITTGDIAYNLAQFNKRMGTAFPGNDNNNPSTEEAKAEKAAQEAAAQASSQIGAEGAEGSSSSSEGSTSSSAGEGADESAGGEGAGMGENLQITKDFEDLKEAQAFIGKWHKLVDVPDETQIIPQEKIEKAIRSLDPEEEFTVGYITPIDFKNKDINTAISLLKCSQFTGFTGIDYRDVSSNDTDAVAKDARIAKANSQIKDPSMHKGEFSANYDQTNKTVNQYTNASGTDMHTILFYNKPGVLPKATYFIDLKNGKGFKQIKKDTIETVIANRLTELGNTVDTVAIHNIIYPNKSYKTPTATDGSAKPNIFALYTSQIYYLDIPSISVKLGKSLAEHFKVLSNARVITEACLTEKKRYSKPREVKRYFIRPQNIYCGNKADVIRALISIGDENCSVYSLKRLEDNKDTHLLNNKDIIYYYDNGILYDKNHVKVMDYDLYIKHEEERKNLGDVDNIAASTFEKEYSDRITDVTGPDLKESINNISNEFDLAFESYNVYGEKLTEANHDKKVCCICGEEIEGYGNNPWPVKEEGECCDNCNYKFVIPARLASSNTKEK